MDLKLDNIPKLPGVYIWKDKNDVILYIGKANNLNTRMHQYFSNHNKNSFMSDSLVLHINSFEYIITKDEKDALILESNLIKEHKPKYNILLIDDKGHRFIRIKLLENNIDIKMSRQYKRDNSLYFGPFPSRHKAKNILDLLNRISKFKDGLPIYTNDSNYWKEKYKLCLKILNPNNNKFKKNMKIKMYYAADNQNFELAKEYKNILESLDFYLPKTIVELTKNINQDIWGVYKKDSYYSICIMFYRNGKLLSIYQCIIKNIMLETLLNYIKSFYIHNIIPDEIYIDSKYINENILNIKIVNPKISNGLKILEMAKKNAEDNFDGKLINYKKNEEINILAIEKLSILLNIKIPRYIIMIDNSVSNNIDPVSALIVYRNGVKQKHEYRKYNLLVNERKADVDYMKQTFSRFLNRNINNLPDLFILDGGIPQVSEINKIISSKKIKINIIGLVKNEKHQTRAIINSKLQEIIISDSLVMNFLASMQIEVDRFAKEHYRTRRIRRSLEGKLRMIKGIGLKTEKKLLDYFGNYNSIYNASISELEKITSKRNAYNIKKTLSK